MDSAALLVAAVEASGLSADGPEPDDTPEIFELEICELSANLSILAEVLAPAGSSAKVCFLCSGAHILRACPMITNLKRQTPFARRAIGAAIRAELTAVQDRPDFQ
jgi:hypothetical protein